MSTRKPPRSDEDFDREIRAHLESETLELIEEGMAPEDARAEARRRFGNVTSHRERFYERGRMVWLDHLVQDVRCAARNLRRAPIAAAIAIASLAAGIGATTVTLAVRDIIFYKPPPLYQDPEQLSRVQVARADRRIQPFGSEPPAGLFLAWQAALGSAIGGSQPARGALDVRTEDRTETAPLRRVTPGMFGLLGVGAYLGHTDLAAPPGEPPRAILGYGVWQRLYDSRADAVGRTIWIERQPHTIVGVMPERFWLSNMDSPIWTALDPRALDAGDTIEVIVRRPSGTTAAALEATLQGGLNDFAARLPTGERNQRMKISGVGGTPMGNMLSIVLPYLLGICVLLTLLIACANVAILIIAQWTAREHEIAIRASIGASRSRIIRALLTESVLIAACGGLLGVAATIGLRAWVASLGGESRFLNLSIDPRVFVQAAIITLMTGILAGIAPALYETRRLHANPLRAIAGSDRVRQRWRSALVVLEITVTVALLVVTSSMVDGYLHARRAQLGYDTRPLLIASVENPAGVPTRDVLEVLKRTPGVAAASAATSVPYAAGRRLRVSIDAAGANPIVADSGSIGQDYFTTLGVSIRAGRAFTAGEAGAAAIVNESLARQLFPDRDAMGNRIWIDSAPYDVVGIVANYSTNAFRIREFVPKIFLPLPDRSPALTRLSLLVRAQGDPAPLTQVVRREVREALSGTLVTSSHTVEQIFEVSSQEILAGTAPLFPLVVIGLLLTTAGIYGVLAFAIARRSRELAVRRAVGASNGHLVSLVTRQSLRLILIGAGAGVAATFALSRVVRAGGGGGSLYDPPAQAFVWPVLIVLAIGVLATWIPARRVLRINPADLLKTT
jgi:predicted permease